ncbi:MAG: CoA activase [Anaerolineae bacterium]|nr:CoA activase [Anaerolineae bacterium]
MRLAINASVMTPLYLGIDVGSTTVKVVVTDGAGSLLDHAYRRAHGQPGRVLLEALEELAQRYDLLHVRGIGVTGSGGNLLAPLLGGLRVNELVAQTRALETWAPHARTVIEIGGQDSKLLVLAHEDGRLRLADFAMNTLCAAGSGSFLDQQAERLGLSITDFAALALRAAKPARIAGRCTVFAKSDMMHLQQRGAPLPDIVAGLCLALARNFCSVIGHGRPFHAPVVFQGGVARNAGMVWAFEQVLGLERGALRVPPHCTLMAALGAARVAQQRPAEASPFCGLEPLARFVTSPRPLPSSLPPLQANRAAPTGNVVCNDDANGPLYLGVDVGSSSTKVVLLDPQGRFVKGVYLPTTGRPLAVVARGLRQVGQARVVGVGVTGSGRRLVGEAIGADIVRDEITAQARAALACDANVDTVFEIGGQDSKYISLRDGVVVDFAMNKACAAGTGSFLEEQSGRMHLPVEEMGPLALTASSPADLGERCAVFVESDLIHHQQQGARQKDLVAGLAYAVARNYLHRVVQRRPVGKRVLFQGGVASNPAVVAAFENLLGQPIRVPPHHALSGAIGAALLAIEARDEYAGTRFRGVGEFPSAPSPAEREPTPSLLAERGTLHPDLFAEREALLLRCLREQPAAAGRPRVGIPRVLAFYDLLPFWTRFFQELGWTAILSPATTPEIVACTAMEASAETCLPAKLVYGHVRALLSEGVERVFVPALVNRPDPLPGHAQSYFCPYVQAIPHLVEAALKMQGCPAPLLCPPLHFLWPGVYRRDVRALARELDASPRQADAAQRAAEEEQQRFEAACRQRGEEVLAGLEEGQPAAVLVGRAYNTADPGINGGIPQKLRRLGVLPVPIDLLPLEEVDISDLVSNMFWHSGQRILAAARLIQSDPRLQAVYMTNFACGPDSFLRSFFREAMGDKPFLELELDDHSADVGLETRLEAFFARKRQGDKAVKGKGERAAHNAPRVSRRKYSPELQVLIPHFCDPVHVLAAAMRHYGLQAEVLPPSDEATLALGRDLCLGRECLPCYTIVGDVVQRARQPDFDPAESICLIPTSAGPCRLGQFHDLLRQVLKREGLQALQIVAPSAENGYQYGGLGVPPLFVGRLAWQGLVAVNLLEKFLHRHRPYERVTGSTDSLYEALLVKVVQAVEAGGGRRVTAALEEAAQRFAGLAVDRSTPRPLIGLVGEMYLRLNPFTNRQIIRRVEALGGEIWLAPMMEWLYYANSFARFSARAACRYGDLTRVLLAYPVQRWEERRLLVAVAAHLPNAHEPTIGWIREAIRPYYHPVLRTEAPLSIGKAIDFARRGADGILNVMPFTCMPGTVVAGLAQRVRTDCGGIPWLDAIFDGQGETNLQTRLEAFLHQASEFRQAKL